MSSSMDPSKLKVVELRAELSSRGLDTKGNKAVLVDRLKEALDRETAQEEEEDEGRVMEQEARGGELLEDDDEEDDAPEDSNLEISQNESELEMNTEVDTSCEIEAKPEPQVKEEPEPEVEEPKISKVEDSKQASSVSDDLSQDIKPEIKQEFGTEEKNKDQMDVTETSAEIKTEKVPEIIEVKDEPQEKMAVDSKDESRDRKDREERRGEKRRRSPSPPRRRSPPRKPDDEPEYDETAVFLSWYDSDMNLIIDKENFTSAAPMHDHGFGYIWAGARATYGVKKGKVFFEVKLIENCDVSHLEDEPTPHVIRVGWSADHTSMQLGEEPLSYGYGGTGKASTDCKFKDYGKPFHVGDVVGALLDLDGDDVSMAFTVNGEMQGIAYSITYSELQDKALFPHILSKNTKFKCNFGVEKPWFPPPEDYTFVAHIPLDQRVSGAKRPEKREDCEMIMMCGLPGSGKTVWANEYYAKHLDKKYNVLGTNNLIDKMKMMGLPRKRNYAGRWDVLIDKCTKCLVKLLEVASRRRRNYILDQTNVYPSAQRRKMRAFEGFIRRAVVVVPTDEEFKRRVEKREKLEGKDVPDSAVLEMKANFMLPEVGDIFNEVLYTELSETESRLLVEQYNREGRDAGYGQSQKRHRNDNRDGRDRSSFRGGYRPRGGPDRNRSGGWQPRGGGGSGGGGGGGWRDSLMVVFEVVVEEEVVVVVVVAAAAAAAVVVGEEAVVVEEVTPMVAEALIVTVLQEAIVINSLEEREIGEVTTKEVVEAAVVAAEVVVEAAVAVVEVVATGEVLVVETGEPRATISKVGHNRTTSSRVGKEVMASSQTMDRIIPSRAMGSKVMEMVAIMPTGIHSSIITRHMAQEHRGGDRLEQMGHMLVMHNKELGKAMAKAITTMVMLVQVLDSSLSRISRPPLSCVTKYCCIETRDDSCKVCHFLSKKT